MTPILLCSLDLEHLIFVGCLSDQSQICFTYIHIPCIRMFFFSNIIAHHSAVYYPHAHQPLRSSSERRRRKKKKEKSLYKSKKASSRPSHLFQPSLDEVAEQVWFYYYIYLYKGGRSMRVQWPWDLSNILNIFTVGLGIQHPWKRVIYLSLCL